MTWYEVSAYLEHSRGIMIPVGSTEQHGPIGLIGTDALVAQQIAIRASRQCGALVAPTLQFTPAPFNTSFPGTISVSEELFRELARELVECLAGQGFDAVYFLNGHGANIAGLESVRRSLCDVSLKVRSWWDFDAVSDLRKQLYGDWEGMHATPSEISITQQIYGCKPVLPEAVRPPKALAPEYIREHSGDRHGPPDVHRKQFPDGRVGSHSALARPEHGRQLLAIAAAEVATDYRSFIGS